MSSGWLFRNTRLRVARRRAQKEIDRALIAVTSDYQGGMAPWLLVQVAHLVVRCVVFLTAVIALVTFFLISHIDKSFSSSAVLPLAVITGIAAHMVKSVLNEISALMLSQVVPTKAIREMEKRLGPIYAEQFAEDIKRLRGLAEQMELARKGRNRAEMLAGTLIPDAPTDAQPQQSTAS